MANQEKKTRDQEVGVKQKDPSKEPQQYRQESGSRITEAEESRESRPSRNEDLDTFDDEDEDSVY